MSRSYFPCLLRGTVLVTVRSGRFRRLSINEALHLVDCSIATSFRGCSLTGSTRAARSMPRHLDWGMIQAHALSPRGQAFDRLVSLGHHPYWSTDRPGFGTAGCFWDEPWVWLVGSLMQGFNTGARGRLAALQQCSFPISEPRHITAPVIYPRCTTHISGRPTGWSVNCF